MEKGRTLIKFLGIMFLGIIVLGCTPKKTANAATTTTGDYFSVEYSNDPYAGVMPFIIDEGGWFMLFRTIKPYKDLRFISIGFDDDFNFFEENVFTTLPDDLGKFVIQAYASEGIPNSGISLTDEKGTRKFFYITLSGIDGSASLSEFQNTPPVVDGGDFTVEIMDVRGLGLELENAIKIIAYTGNNQQVTIPSQIQGLYVTHIGREAFENKNLTSVIIPNSVISIDALAFADNKLTSVIIPDSVIAIGGSAFYRNQLTSVTIPNSVTEIGSMAFSANRLTSLTIPGSVTSIGGSAFENNQLKNVSIPDSVTEIGSGAFSGNQLTSVIIPDSVTSINGVFYNNQLTSVTIPNSITYIGIGTFAENQLTSVTIPNSVTEIDKRAFYRNQLTSVSIGNNVTSIGEWAFADNQLTSVVIPKSVTSIGQAAFSGNQLDGKVTIPNSSNVEIGANAFSNETVIDDRP